MFILSCGGRRNSTPASEKIQKWKYNGLGNSTIKSPPIEEPSTIKVNGQTLIVNLLDHQSKKHKVKLGIHSWMPAYSTYTAALTPVEERAKPESAGLLAHIYNVLQLARDLGGINGCSMTRHSGSGQQLRK